MAFFLETLFGGLMAGMLYSLVALGFVLIFKASGVFNFAQGAMVLVAALSMARFSEWIPQWIGIESKVLANVLAFAVSVVVGHGAQGATGAGFLEKHRQRGHQHGGDQGGHHVLLVDQHATFKDAVEHKDRVFGHAHVDLVDVAAKQGLAETVDEVGDAQGGHEQRHAFLVGQVA